MAYTKHEGIVLRKCDYRENDRIITLLTKDSGKLEISIRGARKPNSPLLSASELFTCGEYVVAKGKGYETLNSFSLIDNFYKLRLDWDLFSIASSMLVCANTAATANEDNYKLYMLLKRSLERLNSNENSKEAVLSAFYIHFSNIEGFKPRLKHCILCEKRIEENEDAYLDIENGGLVCRACAKSAKPSFHLSSEQINWLNSILKIGIGKTEDIKNPPMNELKAYVGYHIEKSLPKLS